MSPVSFARVLVYADLMHTPTAQAAMLIRRPVAEVFSGFTDPAITSKFWFSDGSAVIRDVGQLLRWQWQWLGLVRRESPWPGRWPAGAMKW